MGDNAFLAGNSPLSEPRTIRPAAIKRAVVRASGSPEKEILGSDRHKTVTKARHVLMYLLREDGKLSYPEIGGYVGRDHTTVMHEVKKIEARLKPGVDPLLATLVQAARKLYLDPDDASLSAAPEQLALQAEMAMCERRITVLRDLLAREERALERLKEEAEDAPPPSQPRLIARSA